MLSDKVTDVVIIGGGVYGFSTAYNLAKEGIISKVIEADSLGAKASGRADGILPDAIGAFFYAGSSYCAGGLKRVMVPFMVEGYQRLQQLHLQLKEESGVDFQYGNSPMLTCALSEAEETALANIASDASTANIDIKWLSGDEARYLEKTLSEEVRAAVAARYSYVEPYRYTLALAQGAEKLGASINYAEAVGFRSHGNRVESVVLSTGREVAAGTVVIAMGPWCAQAVSWLGVKIPLGALRGQTLKMVSPNLPEYQLAFLPQAEQEWPHVFMLVSPRVDGTLYLGYTEERTETWDDSHPETWTDSPSAEMKQLMIEHGIRFVPILEDAELVEHRVGVLGVTPGEGMLVGPLPNWENVYMAEVGDNGMATSLTVGRVMTDLIVGGNRAKNTLAEVELISPAKFVLE